MRSARSIAARDFCTDLGNRCRDKLVDTHALTLCLRGVQDSALPRLELFVRRSKLSPCFPRGESYQFGTVNPGIVLHPLIGLKTLSYFRCISQRRSRRKAGLVLLQFWHGQLGSSGGFQRKPIHSNCTGASSRKLRSDKRETVLSGEYPRWTA